jgi:hypothetical protein
MTPVISDYVFKMYNNPMDFIDSEKPGTLPTPSLINFQHALKRVPNLTSSQIKTFVGEIEKNCPYFNNLKSSVFVAYVKMISNAVKMKGSDSRKLNVSPPSIDEFVHTCFTMTAHNFYENPYIMKEQDEKKREEEVESRIRYCIEKAISDSIPMQEILNEYMNGAVNTDETDIENLANPETSTEEQVADILPEPEAPKESTKEDVNTESPITESPFPVDVKKDEDPKVLFPDAPEKI